MKSAILIMKHKLPFSLSNLFDHHQDISLFKLASVDTRNDFVRLEFLVAASFLVPVDAKLASCFHYSKPMVLAYTCLLHYTSDKDDLASEIESKIVQVDVLCEVYLNFSKFLLNSIIVKYPREVHILKAIPLFDSDVLDAIKQKSDIPIASLQSKARDMIKDGPTLAIALLDKLCIKMCMWNVGKYQAFLVKLEKSIKYMK